MSPTESAGLRSGSSGRRRRSGPPPHQPAPRRASALGSVPPPRSPRADRCRGAAPGDAAASRSTPACPREHGRSPPGSSAPEQQDGLALPTEPPVATAGPDATAGSRLRPPTARLAADPAGVAQKRKNTEPVAPSSTTPTSFPPGLAASAYDPQERLQPRSAPCFRCPSGVPCFDANTGSSTAECSDLSFSSMKNCTSSLGRGIRRTPAGVFVGPYSFERVHCRWTYRTPSSVMRIPLRQSSISAMPRPRELAARLFSLALVSDQDVAGTPDALPPSREPTHRSSRWSGCQRQSSNQLQAYPRCHPQPQRWRQQIQGHRSRLLVGRTPVRSGTPQPSPSARA
jgi:hypothetical protein